MRFLRTIVISSLIILGCQAVCCLGAKNPAAEKDTIRFATNRTAYKAAFEEIVRRYKALHPNVNVELTFVPGPHLATYVRTREAAGLKLVPDIYNGNMTKGYDAQGKWVALTPYLQQINPYTGERFIDSFKNLNVHEFDNYGGELYMLPLDLISVGLYYNESVFDQLGLRIPETWREFLNTCQTLRDAGYIPITMPGDFDSFWSRQMGWVIRVLCDTYLRNHVPLVASQPGDWDYDPLLSTDFKYNPQDPFFDRQITLNAERILMAIEDGTIDFQSESFRRFYQRVKELSDQFQKGFMGSDEISTRTAFYKQEAAMMFASSGFVTRLERQMEKSPENQRFETGLMWLPPIADDPYVEGPIRSFLNGGTVLAVTKKNDPSHEARVIDFLMFLSTPASGQLIYDLTLESGYDLVGPLMMKDVKMGPGIAEKYDAFRGYGVMKMEFRGLFDEQKSVGDYVVAVQDYLGDRTDLDTFLNTYDQSMRNAVQRLKIRYNYDLDPATRNTPVTKERSSNPWNPFDNGTYALVLLGLAYLSFAIINIRLSKGAETQKAMVAFSLLSPTCLILVVFSYWPAISGLYYSLTDWSSWRFPSFIGLSNFKALFQDGQFLYGFSNMVVLVLTSILKATLIPFITAQLILRLVSTTRQYWIRTAFLLPMVVPGIVIVLIWRNIYEPTSGLLNQTLAALGFEQLTAGWLGSHATALPAIIFMGFPWIGALGLLIYLAGLMNISEDIKDAFALESSSLFARIIRVDIPMVRSQTRLLVILAVIGSIQDFQAILLMTGGGPGLATHVPAYSMYKEAFIYGNFGYGSAIGTTLFVLILVITLMNMKILKKTELYE